MFQFFENQTAGTFAHHESVTACAERTAGTLRVIVAGREGMHGIETTHAAREDGSFGTTGNDDVRLAQTDQVEGVSQCVGRGGAS